MADRRFRVVGIVAAIVLCGATLAEAHDLAKTRRLTIALVDVETGDALPGVVQVLDPHGKAIALEELMPRGLGVPEPLSIHNWYILPRSAVVSVPAGKLRVRAFSGLETAQAEAEVDLTTKKEADVSLRLTRFYAAKKLGWQNANTHVHLMKVSRAASDKYLIDVARADGLDIVFVSYLERAKEDLEYTTNKYTRADLHHLSNDHVHFDHGEEHRHNFGKGDEGYGHVMLLSIPELILPASLGPGITLEGNDGRPLRDGIEIARDLGAKVIWCHNQWGLEDIPNWLAGKLHANNIFDGGTHGSYEHSFYRYLNAGLRVPFSTGTDWFIYDFSRVYIQTKKRLSAEDWLDRLALAHSYITNGPLLEFSVAGETPGGTVKLVKPGHVEVIGQAVGRLDFQRLELVQNGRVVQKVKTEPRQGYFQAKLKVQVDVKEPCWFALRTPPPSVPKIPEFGAKTPLNEYGRELFSHTSAVFVELAGQRVFLREAAESLLAEMEKSQTFIAGKGLFADEKEKERVLGIYVEGSARLKQRLSEVNAQSSLDVEPRKIETVAGTGEAADGGDGGAAFETNIGMPFGVEIGPDGALYICEVSNHRVRKLDLKSGKLTTVAGCGKQGYSGDGGPATEARLNEPYEVRFDKQGNIYFVEMMNNLIRRVDAKTGVISTVAGTTKMGFIGDGGPARDALFQHPHSIVLDDQGFLYVADIGNHRIRRIDLKKGIVETIAGTGERIMPNDGQPARGNAFMEPRALAIDGKTLWIALRDGHSVWTLDLETGLTHHVAGDGKAGYAGDGGPLKAARFNGPKGIALGPDKDLFVVDTENQVIRRIDLVKGAISTVAGSGPKAIGPAGDGGPATKAEMNRPHGICVGADGSIYIGDSVNHRVRRVIP